MFQRDARIIWFLDLWFIWWEIPYQWQFANDQLQCSHIRKEKKKLIRVDRAGRSWLEVTVVFEIPTFHVVFFTSSMLLEVFGNFYTWYLAWHLSAALQRNTWLLYLFLVSKVSKLIQFSIYLYLVSLLY